jgi:hypothetical protein
VLLELLGKDLRAEIQGHLVTLPTRLTQAVVVELVVRAVVLMFTLLGLG